MDTIYTGDIPSEYHYARFSNNYIDLYKNEHLTGYQDFYRLYLYDNTFIYDHLSTNYTQYNETVATYINTTDNYMYRRDFPSIMIMSFIYIILLVFLFNIVTSVFKKGGLLSGLL